MKKVVVIGGGTGTFTVLSGLKKYPIKLSAIVSMADDGGSTGILRDELGVLPPGDVRQCLIALSDSSEKMRELMNYRFEDGSLKGHSFGNLFLSALEKINGSFSQGVKEAMKILNVKGEVIPVTNDNASINAELNNGDIVIGEHKIDYDPIKDKIKRIFYEKETKPNPEAIKKILEADTIIIGPGSHYAGIIPHFIIPEVSSAINRCKAKVVYIVNLTNKKGHTEGFDVDDYVDSIESYIGKGRIDYLIHNNSAPPEYLLKRYMEQEGENPLVAFNPNKITNRNYYMISGNFIDPTEVKIPIVDMLASNRSFIRHDSNILANSIMNVVNMKLWIFDLDDVIYDKSSQLGEVYENLDSITPFPDAHRVLQKLSGVKVLLTKSRDGEHIQNKKIELLKIRDYFDRIIVVCGDDEKKTVLESLLLKYKVNNRKQVLVIGDRIDSEIRYGNLLGCTTVLFALPHGKYANLKPKDAFEIPDFTIHSLSELLSLNIDNGR